MYVRVKCCSKSSSFCLPMGVCQCCLTIIPFYKQLFHQFHLAKKIQTQILSTEKLHITLSCERTARKTLMKHSKRSTVEATVYFHLRIDPK